jgi:AAA ATPase domain
MGASAEPAGRKLAGASAGLAGREPALTTAHAALESALAGNGHLLLICGDAGIGKTAVARVILAAGARQGASVIWAACAAGIAPAYWAWTQVVRHVQEATGATLPSAARRLLPGHSAPDSHVSGPVGAAAERFELFDAVTCAVTMLTHAAPTVIVFDDLHEADAGTVELLDFVARHTRSRPLLLLGTYRDLEATDALQRLEAIADGITLGGLGEPEVASIVTTSTGIEPTAELTADLCRRTGGNPLFVRELARLLVTSSPAGRIGTNVGPSAARSLPATISHTLRQRLAKLSQPCRDLLSVVAVLNSDSQDLLIPVLAGTMSPAQIGSLLEEAAVARVLAGGTAPDRSAPFSHDLFREAVLAELSPEDLGDLHQSAAQALIQLRPRLPSVSAAEIASHLRAALGPRQRTLASDAFQTAVSEAVHWSVAAAQEAISRLAHVEAGRHYEDGLSALQTFIQPGAALPGLSRAELLLGLARAQASAGHPASRETYLQAAQAAQAEPNATALAQAALGLHRLGARAADAHRENLDLLHEAIGQVQPGTTVQALLLAALAREMRHSLQSSEAARRPAEEAVAVARDLGDPATLASCLLALHDAQWQPGTARPRLTVTGQMADAARTAGDTELAAQAKLLRAACLLELNDHRGRAALEDFCVMSEALGHARGRWDALSRRATAALIAGRLDNAEKLSGEAYRLGTDIGLPDAAGVHGTLRWQLSRFTGWGMDIASELESLDAVPAKEAFLAAAYHRAGDTERAHTLAASLTADNLPGNYDLEFSALIAEGLAAGGNPQQIGKCYSSLAPYAGTNIIVGGCASFWGPVDLYLAELAAAQGDREQARAHLLAARGMAENLGAPLWAELAASRLGTLTGGEGPGAGIPGNGEFRHINELWVLTWAGVSAHVPDAKGLRDLAILLSRPGEDVAAIELTGGRPAMGADPLLDYQAKAAYRQRLRELDALIDEADADNDPYRAEKARAEKDVLIDQLTAAAGLGGRGRRLGDERERARKAVTARIRDAIARIERAHPALGAHLSGSIKTGTWCGYRPAVPVSWQIRTLPGPPYRGTILGHDGGGPNVHLADIYRADNGSLTGYPFSRPLFPPDPTGTATAGHKPIYPTYQAKRPSGIARSVPVNEGW